ncbi:HAMP domain-containing sensor histidine kinase [Lactobacillus hamsteri]|nr:HAMP domain-containing histidine kinase [Lactobacillus hamsteri]
MKMMTSSSQAKKKKKEAKHSSLIVRWVSIVSLTIVVSFVIFSVIIYSTVSQQTLNQQEETSNRVIVTLNRQLSPISEKLQISNVVPALSPSTRRLLKGGPNIKDENDANNAFSDDLISSISNPDISVAVYNKHDEVVFTNGNNTPEYHAFKGDYHTEKLQTDDGTVLKSYQKIVSSTTNKVIGYIIVTNRMTYYNHLMSNLLRWMIIISVVAIIIFILIAFIVVRDVVNPIKEMSKVAREVNDDPNSNVRIRDFDRNDELGDLAVSFNKMLDRMQRYIDQQKQFVGDVSHELRTPVAVIEGHLNMLERWGKDDPEILDESIKASLQEADRMKHLIQEMLDLTRAEQIDVQYPNAITRAADVLKRVTSDMAMVHKDFNVQLDIDDLPEDTMIQIYQGHLEQILVILIDNGIKYSTDRKQINVSADVTEDQMHIIVQDFGEGISEEDQAKIFNRFYRVDKARTREKGGNGLGLSIAQKLVESYRGEISVESVLGQGSQFKVVFPVLSSKDVERLEGKNDLSDDSDNLK